MPNAVTNRAVCLLLVLMLSILASGVGAAQDLPTPSDSYPEFDFAIDPAAAAAGLRPLRLTRLGDHEREIRVWTGFGLAIPDELYRIRVSNRQIHGALIYWWDHGAEWGPSDSPESMHTYVTRAFGCGRIRRREETDACEAKLRPKPDWRRVLVHLDSLGIRSLRSPTRNGVVADGFHIVVETRDGALYRTAYFADLSASAGGDAVRMQAILDLLLKIREASVRDSSLKRR